MLGYYLSFDGSQFPNPLPSSRRRSEVVETVNRSEAGTDLVVMTRSAKRTWNFDFALSNHYRRILENLSKEEQVTMTYMGYTYIVRVRDYSEQLIEGSEWSSESNGLYNCSVTVTEY